MTAVDGSDVFEQFKKIDESTSDDAPVRYKARYAVADMVGDSRVDDAVVNNLVKYFTVLEHMAYNFKNYVDVSSIFLDERISDEMKVRLFCIISASIKHADVEKSAVTVDVIYDFLINADSNLFQGENSKLKAIKNIIYNPQSGSHIIEDVLSRSDVDPTLVYACLSRGPEVVPPEDAKRFIGVKCRNASIYIRNSPDYDYPEDLLNHFVDIGKTDHWLYINMTKLHNLPDTVYDRLVELGRLEVLKSLSTHRQLNVRRAAKLFDKTNSYNVTGNVYMMLRENVDLVKKLMDSNVKYAGRLSSVIDYTYGDYDYLASHSSAKVRVNVAERLPANNPVYHVFVDDKSKLVRGSTADSIAYRVLAACQSKYVDLFKTDGGKDKVVLFEEVCAAAREDNVELFTLFDKLRGDKVAEVRMKLLDRMLKYAYRYYMFLCDDLYLPFVCDSNVSFRKKLAAASQIDIGSKLASKLVTDEDRDVRFAMLRRIHNSGVFADEISSVAYRHATRKEVCEMILDTMMLDDDVNIQRSAAEIALRRLAA